jgi:hypothetical protein
MAGATRGARFAPVERHDRDRVADRPALDVAADGGDPPRHLVADDRRDVDATIHRTVLDVQVGPTDPDVRDVDPDLVRTGFDRLLVGDGERLVADVLRCEHVISFLS